MKRLFFLLSAFFLVFLSNSCEKELSEYSGKEGVYFGVQWGPSHGDSTVWAYQSYTPLEFIKVAGSEDTVKIRVMVTGRVKDFDRKFNIQINADSTTATEKVHYEPIESSYIIPAGKLYTDIMVPVHRTEDLQEEMKTVGIQLLPSDDFELSVPKWFPVKGYWESSRSKIFDATHHKIELTDFFQRPPVWPGRANDGLEGGTWGDYTSRKFVLMCALEELTYDDFQSTETMPPVYQKAIGEVMVAYLQAKYDAKEYVLEADGRLMWVQGVSWTSKLGVPFKPSN